MYIETLVVGPFKSLVYVYDVPHYPHTVRFILSNVSNHFPA